MEPDSKVHYALHHDQVERSTWLEASVTLEGRTFTAVTILPQMVNEVSLESDEMLATARTLLQSMAFDRLQREVSRAAREGRISRASLEALEAQEPEIDDGGRPPVPMCNVCGVPLVYRDDGLCLLCD